jgi:hypothetical protein
LKVKPISPGLTLANCNFRTRISGCLVVLKLKFKKILNVFGRD